jgi:hypothetical protein
MDRIDAIYLLCHPEKEFSRWQRLQTHLQQRGIPASKCIQMAPTWGDQLDHTVFELYNPFYPRECPFLSWKGRSLSKGEISLILNFWSAVDHALEHHFKHIIIFESDVYLRDDFMERLTEMMDLLETREWDFVSLSDGVGTHAERPDGSNSIFAKTGVYKPPHQFPFRCTDSMLFRVDILRRMRPQAFPFRECLDWELNYQLGSIGGKALWVEPHLVEQGTVKHRLETFLPA